MKAVWVSVYLFRSKDLGLAHFKNIWLNVRRKILLLLFQMAYILPDAQDDYDQENKNVGRWSNFFLERFFCSW